MKIQGLCRKFVKFKKIGWDYQVNGDERLIKLPRFNPVKIAIYWVPTMWPVAYIHVGHFFGY